MEMLTIDTWYGWIIVPAVAVVLAALIAFAFWANTQTARYERRLDEARRAKLASRHRKRNRRYKISQPMNAPRNPHRRNLRCSA